MATKKGSETMSIVLCKQGVCAVCKKNKFINPADLKCWNCRYKEVPPAPQPKEAPITEQPAEEGGLMLKALIDKAEHKKTYIKEYMRKYRRKKKHEQQQ